MKESLGNTENINHDDNSEEHADEDMDTKREEIDSEVTHGNINDEGSRAQVPENIITEQLAKAEDGPKQDTTTNDTNATTDTENEPSHVKYPQILDGSIVVGFAEIKLILYCK